MYVRSSSQKPRRSSLVTEHAPTWNQAHGGAASSVSSSTTGGGGGASSRRRKMAFLKYGSESQRSTSSMHRSRQHAKQIATTLGDDFPSPMSAYTSAAGSSFADFGSAFGGGSTSNNNPVDLFGTDPFATQHEDNHNSSTQQPQSLWDENPFEAMDGSNRHHEFETNLPHTPKEVATTTNRGSQNPPQQQQQDIYRTTSKAQRSMSTLPSNSSMQSSFPPQQQQKEQHQQLSPAVPSPHGEAPVRPCPQPAASPPPKTNHAVALDVSPSGAVPPGGAAARRRMRMHMRKGGGSSSATSGPTALHRSDSDSFSSQTPPHSPQSMKRYHSSDSIGSKGTSKAIDHVSNYSVINHHSRNQQHHNMVMMSANRSVGSTRSVTSSASSSEMNLFDTKHRNAGFTFDAFGLDASLINQEVNEAMHDIAGNNPDLSFFLDQDPTDDFAAGRWDSPPQSRSSTPLVHDNNEEQDGFVDGFRVTNKVSSMLPVHISKQSPTSTEKSSLTSESSDLHNAAGATIIPDGQINRFKQQAGFHQSSKPRKVIRPDESLHNIINNKSRSPVKARVQLAPVLGGNHRGDMRLPKLDGRPTPTSKNHAAATNNTRQPSDDEPLVDDDGVFEADFSDFSGSSSQNGDKPQAPSDVGVSADFAPPTSSKAVDIVAELKARKEERSLASVDDNRSFQTQDEKKEEEFVASEKQPRVGSLKEQWEMREAARKAELTLQNATLRTTTASPSKFGKSSGKADNINARPANEEAESELQQQPSFSSIREQLRPVTPRGEYTGFGAKSEAGAGFRSSHVSLALDGLGQKDAPRDARSDVGAPSPSFANLKLRRTAVASPNAARVRDNDFDGSPTSPTDRRRDYQDHAQPQQPEQQPEEPKLTYRERRELELKQQLEEQFQARASQKEEKSPERDVATLIKRRIAASKRGSTVESDAQSDFGASAQQVPMTESMKPYDESPRALPQSGKSSAFFANDEPRPQREAQLQSEPAPMQQSPTRLAVHRPPQLNLEHSVQPKHDAAVSHLLMLQQIQQRQREQGSSRLSDHQDTAEHPNLEEKSQKATTPKATMMMLNAFLAGRESLVSKEPIVGGKSMQSSNETDRDGDRGSTASDQHQDPKFAAYSLPARKDDPKYERYYKMLKVGMPMDVVKHAVMRDGLDPAVLDGDPNKPVGVPLRHDPEFAKYFKMLSIGLPMEAVKHAMARDGLDSSIMDQDHDLPLQNRKKGDEDEEPKEKDSHRRARLHWKPLRSVTSNSMWAKIDQDEELEKLKFNEKEFQELFQVEKATEAAQKASQSSSEPKRGAVRVIDPKRANNGGIILARLKMSHDEMADAVDGINERALTAEQIENIIEYLPTREERKALESYMLGGGQDAAEKFEGLCECEKFMVSMMTVKHAKRKVRALLFKLQFQTCLEDIHRDTVTVEAACDELCNSVRLRKLLGIVLTFGNRLNTAGNGKHRAGAFTLDSLLKLNQAKAFDKKTTFLHYIVLIVQRNNELLLRFKDDIPTVFKADKVYWDQCVNDLEEVENQLENVRKIALYQARQAMAYRLRRKKRDEDEESLSDGEASLTLEEEVEALRATPIGMFTLSAIKYVSSLRDQVEETKAKYGRLLEYFGEESNMQPHDLFNIIVAFSRDFDKAKEQVFANEKRKQREERKRQAVASNGMNQHGRPPTYSPAQTERTVNEKSMKASNLQPSMSHVLKEIKARVSRDDSDSVPARAEQHIPEHPEVRESVARPLHQTENPSVRHQPTVVYDSGVYESVRPLRPTENRPPERRSQAAILAERENSRRTSANAAVARSSTAMMPAPALHANLESAPITPSKSPPTIPTSGSTSIRAKARLRRHRYSIERSPSSPPPPESMQTISTPPAPQSAPSPPRTPEMMSPHQRLYGRADASMDGSAQPVNPKPLSPRSSMRHRMERHKLRQQTTTTTQFDC